MKRYFLSEDSGSLIVQDKDSLINEIEQDYNLDPKYDIKESYKRVVFSVPFKRLHLSLADIKYGFLSLKDSVTEKSFTIHYIDPADGSNRQSDVFDGQYGNDAWSVANQLINNIR